MPLLVLPFSPVFVSQTTASLPSSSSSSCAFCRRLIFMASSSFPSPPSTTSLPTVFPVPGLNPEEVDRVAEASMERYSSREDSRSRTGRGTVIVWFRNDLRVMDNEVLYEAWRRSEVVLPVYCVDPRHFDATHHFGFPKTGGEPQPFLRVLPPPLPYIVFPMLGFIPSFTRELRRS